MKIKEKRRPTILNRRGEGYVDTALMVMVASMLLIICVNIFGLIMMKQKINYIASELVETATTIGGTGTELSERLNDLKQENGFGRKRADGISELVVSYSGTEYMSGSTEKVQLGNKIVVSVSSNIKIKGMGAFAVSVEVKSTQSGASKVYWK